MNKKLIKDFTTLIYADGNNELEPEMWKSKIDAEKVGSSDNVNIVIQIARENMELVKIMRPSDSLIKSSENWTGVRRYYILKSESALIKDLGTINMAEPHNLYNFIKWGIENYPSKHYMLILSGHGGGFISVMPDLSQDRPYMMGVYEMCKVINMIYMDMKVQIDILALDICDMNFVELMYELGKEKINTVKTVLTYISSGSINGFPYDKLINCISSNINECDHKLMLKSMIDYIDLNLVAIEINHIKLKKIKKLTSTIAHLYLTEESLQRGGGFELLNNIDSKASWYKYILELRSHIESIIIYYKNSFFNNYNIINILNLTTREMCNNDGINAFLPFYYKLSFAKNNYWFNLLFNKSPKDTITCSSNKVLLKPLIITPDGVMRIILAMNPSLSEDKLKLILKKLYLYKKWSDFNDYQSFFM